jgi:hypothetical protein
MKGRLLAIIAALIATSASARAGRTYQTVQTVPIANGYLQILEDRRLTHELARELWSGGASDPVLALDNDDPRVATFKARPALPARLRQVTSSGAVVADVILEDGAPIARIEKRRLGEAADPLFLVTTDDDAGFGSYSGKVTRLYAMRDGRMAPVMAKGVGGKLQPVLLIDTLKSGWRLVDPRPDHIVVEQLLCRPDFDRSKPEEDQGFLLSYITYWSDGNGWRVAKRVVTGFWEADEAWPKASEFPRPGG